MGRLGSENSRPNGDCHEHAPILSTLRRTCTRTHARARATRTRTHAHSCSSAPQTPSSYRTILLPQLMEDSHSPLTIFSSLATSPTSRPSLPHRFFANPNLEPPRRSEHEELTLTTSTPTPPRHLSHHATPPNHLSLTSPPRQLSHSLSTSPHVPLPAQFGMSFACGTLRIDDPLVYVTD